MMPLSNLNNIYYLSKKQLFNSKEIKKKANPIYLQSCLFFGATLIDRTKNLDSGIDFTILDKIPQTSNTSKTFSEICSERAREIINATDGGIKVLWSGGIDSTVALISLINELKSIDKINRLSILLSKESIIEYPTFFNDIIDNKLNYEMIKTTIFNHIQPTETIVTGEHGDQLFGSDKLKYPILTGDAFTPYEDILEFIISRKLGTDKFTNQIIDFIAPVIKESPFKIISLYDYMWWLNFSLKWQTVSMRLIHGLERSHEDLETSVFHFFKSNSFQVWSLENHSSKIKEEWNTYKYIAKEFIYDFHKDPFYLEKKEKEQSLKEVLVNKTNFSALTFSKKIFNQIKNN
ncbi:hypothetical protein LNI98_07985 [Tenacibaculum dicentrarchi]|nr:hypothetical protein [Tenacibaculum dicentrarchi]MCD8407654.1 hypothetical protein [Tenacibaculum dicentrarchi]MCD8425051.1 hypothetical protein [Tenacibaculum dicentrarchi]MCD8449636.1 hypothetical protein [Tenacibaculum dicentrarchi]SOS46875.1 conserved hypothetical protein [Tenacibaculum dicentrarchi]